MTQFPEDDKPLVHFLKRNSPTPPPPSFDLEDRIMAAVEQSSPQGFNSQAQSLLNLLRQRVFWVSTAIATSATLTWMGYYSMTPTRLSLAEERELEAFLAENWNAATTANAHPDWFVPQTTASE